MFVRYESTAVTLLATFTADFDEDVDVDGKDFLAWQRGFGTESEAEHGGGDANADVDEDDFLIWQTQFGSVAGSVAGGGATTAVPEPGALALLLLAATAFGWRRA